MLVLYWNTEEEKSAPENVQPPENSVTRMDTSMLAFNSHPKDCGASPSLLPDYRPAGPTAQSERGLDPGPEMCENTSQAESQVVSNQFFFHALHFSLLAVSHVSSLFDNQRVVSFFDNQCVVPFFDNV